MSIIRPGLVRSVPWLVLLAMLNSCEPNPKLMDCTCSSAFFARAEHCSCMLGVVEDKPLRRRMFSSIIKQSLDVKIDGTVTVKQGAVKMWFEDKDNIRHEFIAKPGAPAKLTGRPGAERSANTDDVTFSINVQAINGSPAQAEGIKVEFDYVVGE